MNPRPVAISMGCPVGIGPEVILRLFMGHLLPSGQQVVVGDRGVLQATADHLGISIPMIPWQPGEPVSDSGISVLSVSSLDPDTLEWGRPDGTTGKAMAVYIEEAVRLVQEKACTALVTCPIAKYSLNLAGYPYPGHTEMLAALTRTQMYRMMMAGSRLKVVLVTIHEPLSRVSQLLSKQAVVDCISLTYQSLQVDFDIADPEIAVAGLNPHGGELGMFGDEEAEVIAPAVEACNSLGKISGPWPPDTLFHQAARGKYDAVIAMYHDQGLIPFKMLHFEDGVNVTLGLPIVRTSVDHGTAYDIAGQGKADPGSLQAAVSMAQAIVANRKRSSR